MVAMEVAGPVDISDLVEGLKIPKNYDGLLAQPQKPKYKTALVQTYVPKAEMGGSDKLTNGHRFDSIPMANGLINSGISCQPIFYVKEEHDKFFEVLKRFDAVVVRINPGQLTAAGADQNKFDKDMQALNDSMPVWPTPDVMTKMGAKDALCQIKNMDFGLPDTLGYYAPEEMEEGFKKTVAFQPRVIKQNRGSAGEGIWIIKLKSGEYCKNYGDRACGDDEMLILKEANDNHVEEHTVSEFIEWCVNGRTEKSGTWVSKGQGKYFEGGREAGGQMVDQRFLPKIEEGEARFMMVGRELYRIEHYVYLNGVGADTKTTIYPPDAPLFAENRAKLEKEVPDIMNALGLDMKQLPLLWAADFIPIDDNPPSPWIVGEFNCSCLGISGFLKSRGKDLKSIAKEEYDAGQAMCDHVGREALKILECLSALGPVDVSDLPLSLKVAKSNDGLLGQPQQPLFKTALVQTYVPKAEMGGSDKLTNGHRFDSIPMANGLINAGISCQPLFYVKEEHDKFFEVLKRFDAVVVRINPGQLTAAGADQQKFDVEMQALSDIIPVWPTPDVMTKMGAKDALCQIKDMDFGLKDTLGYYAPSEMEEGFKKTVAFQPRVIKQNRGSAGEGIWIVKLKSGNYCKNYGDRACANDEMLVLKEANDNHIEEHTVGEFIEWCVNGRTDKSGTWVSKGQGKYFEGGREAGGQMVDQRFLPKIEEGEARFMMVGSELYRIEHYVYLNGVGADTKTTIYAPDAELFASNRAKLEKEVPDIMAALGLDMKALPLLWAADFIPIDDNPPSPWIVGEFNCSCLGISGFLKSRGKDLKSISKEEYDAGQAMCDHIGREALKILQTTPKTWTATMAQSSCSVL